MFTSITSQFISHFISINSNVTSNMILKIKQLLFKSRISRLLCRLVKYKVVHTQRTSKGARAFSISINSVLFITGLPLLVCHPHLFHFGIHCVMHFIRNCESVLILSFFIPPFWACRAAIVTAWISAMLFVALPFTGCDTFLENNYCT